VLGRVKTERIWQWGAYGKQPWARDYFKIGAAFPLLNGFADWIEKGYNTVASKNTPAGKQHSWRFWTRDARQDHVVCGVIRDSADALGRPYPFLIIGAGPLDGWEKKWELLPFVFDNVWGQVEYLCTRMYSDSKVLDVEVSSIRSPIPEWSRFIEERERLVGGSTDSNSSSHPFSKRDTEGFLRIDEQPYDYFKAVGLCHEAIKRHADVPPNAVFMGGALDRTYFVYFRRPLTTSDFTRLWLAENGSFL
jgi:type VI secretion system ImpM family protein